MATLKVFLKDGFFVDSNKVYLDGLTPTEVCGNGWICQIEPNGTIVCISSRKYSDGTHSIQYVIQPNGFAKLTLRVPGEKDKVLKKGFVLRRGEKLSNGTIGLAGGHVDCRYAYFRNESLTNFMEKHGLTAIKHEDPNQIFELRHISSGRGDCISTVETDGKNTIINRELLTYTNGSLYSYKVSDASWVIITVKDWYGDNRSYSRILYTLNTDLESLELPVK